MRKVYADYAATTPADKTVLKYVRPYFLKIFGNPSSSHSYGLEAKNAVIQARDKTAKFFNCSSDEVIFTSGGTESENLAIKGLAFSNQKNGKHVVISTIEHAAVSSSVDFLERQGFAVTRIPVGRNCIVDVKDIESSIRSDTILISVMYVNNEIGAIQPIEEISKMLERINSERRSKDLSPILFHVDGEAGSIYMDYDVKKLGVSSISVNGSKIYGLKGASALYVKKGVHIATQICGGGQESMVRGGTENVPAIIALAEALTRAVKNREKNIKRISKIKKSLEDRLIRVVAGARVNTPSYSVPNILHVTFGNRQYVDIVTELDRRGVCVSNGSACASNKGSRSKVLEAIGFDQLESDMSVRFSLGRYNKMSDVKYIIKQINSLFEK